MVNPRRRMSWKTHCWSTAGKPLHSLLFAAVWSFWPAPQPARAAEPAWEFAERSGRVSLYTATTTSHEYDLVKAVVTIAAPATAIVARLRDFKHYPRWYQDCRQVRVLQRPQHVAAALVDRRGRFLADIPAESYVVLYVQDAGPLADRWAVIRNTLRAVDGAAVATFHSLDDTGLSGPDNGVRMTMHGRWVLEPISRQRTRVTLEVDVNPRTSAPAFVVDSKLREIALRTLQNLNKLTTTSNRY